jgi:hypothetical protein
MSGIFSAFCDMLIGANCGVAALAETRGLITGGAFWKHGSDCICISSKLDGGTASSRLLFGSIWVADGFFFGLLLRGFWTGDDGRILEFAAVTGLMGDVSNSSFFSVYSCEKRARHSIAVRSGKPEATTLQRSPLFLYDSISRKSSSRVHGRIRKLYVILGSLREYSRGINVLCLLLIYTLYYL